MTKTPLTIVITKPHNPETGWIEGTIDERWFQAKVYDLPSEFGLRNGRVSKLSMCMTPYWNHYSCYVNYSRNWHRKPPKGENNRRVRELLDYLEQLPLLFTYTETELA